MNAASLRERKRSGRLAAMAPPFVPTNRANYVSLARPPRTGNETLPEFLHPFRVYMYMQKDTFTFTRATPRDIRAYPPARARARLEVRSGNVVGLSPAEGIRYDDGDNLRLYPRAGQRFN